MDVARGPKSVVVGNGRIEIAIATTYGPRITRFALDGGVNVFAELGGLSIEHPSGSELVLGGGHRLWAAPEVPELTYEPDGAPVAITETGHSVMVEHSSTTVSKTIEVSLNENAVTVNHTLSNSSATALQIAPWAITQLPIGGTALVPLPLELADDGGFQSNASISLWPYTTSDGQPFLMDQGLIFIEANRSAPTKVGTSLARGWVAYRRNDTVFVKRSSHVPGARYVDNGASAQCYCNDQFVELETLGPLVDLTPNTSVTHAEVWELHSVDPTTPAKAIPELLNLDEGSD